MNALVPPARLEAADLTVVMPVHDGADYLDATLSSLAAEADSRVAVILIDSSTDDRCEHIAARYRQNLNIRYERRCDILPWTAKTNIGVSWAKTPYICMLHQDDVWLPGRLKRLRQAIEADPTASLYLSPAQFIGSDGRVLGAWRCPLMKQRRWETQDMLDRLIVQNFVAIPAPVIRTSDWLAVGGMDEALWYTADWDLYLKLVQLGHVAYDPEPTTAFRIHGNSQTINGSRNAEDFRNQMQIVLNRYESAVHRSSAIEQAKLSIEINVNLARILAGERSAVFDIIKNVLAISPRNLLGYLEISRIFERLNPRIKARFQKKL